MTLQLGCAGETHDNQQLADCFSVYRATLVTELVGWWWLARPAGASHIGGEEKHRLDVNCRSALCCAGRQSTLRSTGWMRRFEAGHYLTKGKQSFPLRVAYAFRVSVCLYDGKESIVPCGRAIVCDTHSLSHTSHAA